MSLTAVEAARSLAQALEETLQAIPDGSRGDAERAVRRLQDVVLPRLEDADAPVLVVVGVLATAALVVAMLTGGGHSVRLGTGEGPSVEATTEQWSDPGGWIELRAGMLA